MITTHLHTTENKSFFTTENTVITKYFWFVIFHILRDLSSLRNLQEKFIFKRS